VTDASTPTGPITRASVARVGTATVVSALCGYAVMYLAARDLEPGHVLGPGDIVAKSPADGGLPPYELDRLIGRPLLRPLRFEQDVALDDVELAEELAARGSVDA